MRYMILLAALAAMTACSPEDEPQPQQDITIEVPDTGWTETNYRF